MKIDAIQKRLLVHQNNARPKRGTKRRITSRKPVNQIGRILNSVAQVSSFFLLPGIANAAPVAMP